MTPKARKRIRWGLAGLILMGVVAVAAWWYWPEPDRASGEELFSTHDLGSPFATGIPYALALANKGVKQAVLEDPGLLAGVNTYAGHITCEPVAQSLGRPFRPLLELL